MRDSKVSLLASTERRSEGALSVSGASELAWSASHQPALSAQVLRISQQISFNIISERAPQRKKNI